MNAAALSTISASTLSPSLTDTVDESVSAKYTAFIQEFYNVQTYQTRDEINSSDMALEQFKKDISTKGAAQFLNDLNEEKIKTLVEEYRQKLLKEKEANPEKPIDINKMVSDYRKLLLKEMMEAQKAEAEKQKQEQKAKTMESQTLSTADLFNNIQEPDLKSSKKESVGLLELMMNTVCIKPDSKETDN
jgi:hypothetical protein